MNLTNFKTWSFLFFIAASLLCYYAAPKKHQWKILLLANIFFYVSSGAFNIIFMAATACSTFFCARKAEKINAEFRQKKSSGEFSRDYLKIQKAASTRRKRAVLIFVVSLNFGILFFLKYWNTIAEFFSAEFLKIGSNRTLLLPLGISFYTFQSFSYFMDVYNEKFESEKNFFKYFLFVSFFPQLVMGPINRFDKIGHALSAERKFDFENFKRGILLILFGAMKKYCIADMLVLRISSVLDNGYERIPGVFIAMAILAYSVYQYADFSGGIDMVRGFSELFGIEMQENFRQPYFSVSLADFWRRWHISLGLWMKDYVFYPLAFTKKMQSLTKFCQKKMGKHFARTVPAGISNIIVFLLVGIWHGPEMHFVLWGLYNGIVIAVSDMAKPAFEKISSALKIKTESKAFYFFRILRTFLIVNIGWYFDRISDVRLSFVYLKNTFTHFYAKGIFKADYLKSIFGSFRNADSELVLIFVAGAIVFACSLLKERKIDLYESIQKKNIALRWISYYVPMILVILSFSFAPDNPVFMYAQY